VEAFADRITIASIMENAWFKKEEDLDVFAMEGMEELFAS